MKKVLVVAAIVLVLLGACYAVLLQQINAWVDADLDRNVDEFNSYSTFDGCMDQIDGVWLPWLVSEAREMCAAAVGRDR